MHIEWNEEDSVGVESIDDQHKHLVEIIDGLFAAIMYDVGDVVAKEALEDLAQYVGEHFTHEEQLLAQHDYPADLLRSHIEEHRKLTAELYEFMVEYREGNAEVDLDLFKFLRDWMTSHLQQTDKHYAEFLKSKGVQ